MIEHIIDEGAWIVVIMVAFLAMAMHSFMTQSIIYDQSPVITSLRQIPKDERVRAGDQLYYFAWYDKRDDCRFVSGSYSLAGQARDTGQFTLLNFSSASTGTWLPGRNRRVKAGVTLPKGVPPGHYVLWWRYCWSCSGARGLLCTPPQLHDLSRGAMPTTGMRIEVIE